MCAAGVAVFLTAMPSQKQQQELVGGRHSGGVGKLLALPRSIAVQQYSGYGGLCGEQGFPRLLASS